MVVRIAAKLYEAMGMQRWLPSISQSEYMSKSKHDHLNGGYSRPTEPIAFDQSSISWLVSHLLC